jgi:hypothetical protein
MGEQPHRPLIPLDQGIAPSGTPPLAPASERVVLAQRFERQVSPLTMVV